MTAEEKYNNFNAQMFYEKFEQEYKKKLFDKYKRKIITYPFKEWVKKYIKSGIFEFLVLTLVALLLSSFIVKGMHYKYTLCSWVPIFLLCTICYYCSTFSEEEKKIADSVLDEMMKDGGINKTETSLEKIINASINVGDQRLRLLATLKESGIYQYFKSVFLTFSGIVIGFISSELTKEGMEYASKTFLYLFYVILQISFYFICFYILFYYFVKTLNRIYFLYIEVLKDKSLTIGIIEKFSYVHYKLVIPHAYNKYKILTRNVIRLNNLVINVR